MVKVASQRTGEVQLLEKGEQDRPYLTHELFGTKVLGSKRENRFATSPTGTAVRRDTRTDGKVHRPTSCTHQRGKDKTHGCCPGQPEHKAMGWSLSRSSSQPQHQK